MLRSCYRSTWHLPGVGDVEGYYYFSPPGTPFFEDWSWLGSRNWHQGDGTPWPIYGEKVDARQVWRDGSFPVNFPDARVVGSRGCLQSETPDLADVTLVYGVDRRCWQGTVTLEVLPSLGTVTGGQAEASEEEEADGEGGTETGGSSFTTFDLEADALGGDELGGSSFTTFDLTAPAAGGDQVGGSAESAADYSTEATGGDQVGGSSDSSAEYSTEATGGDQLGGDSHSQPNGAVFHAPIWAVSGGSSTSSKTP